jgi:hypothetical protein
LGILQFFCFTPNSELNDSELEVFMRENVSQRLAKHLSSLGMGYPEKEELLEILRENFTPLEAEVALAIPTKVIPFEPVPVGEIVPPSHPSEEAGLVHLVDNAREGIKHTCNCCGCCVVITLDY